MPAFLSLLSRIQLSGIPANTRLVVEQLPGEAADGDALTLPATLALPRTVVITPLPSGPTDVDTRSTVPLTLTVQLTR